jgi:hypothetical protein
VGCIEAAVMSGLEAAKAIAGDMSVTPEAKNDWLDDVRSRTST